MMAQKVEVQGSVKDSEGASLPGVSVSLKGNSKVGTITGADGQFVLSIQEKEAKDLLVFTYMGFAKQEIPIGREYMNVVMTEDHVYLDEVVVIGYGAVRKSDLTGAVSTVKMDKLATIPSNSIDGLLQGRSAGLQVVNSSQTPGDGSIVRIRGGSSLRGSNSPLLVVDGFPIGDAGNLKQINPDNIASIEVLKDASASAIYGSRGANGVIIITTKTAEKGKTLVTVKNQLTISRFSTDTFRFSDPLLMMELYDEARINSNFDPLYVGAVAPSGLYYPSLEEVESGAWPYFTDWADIVFRDAPVLNNTSVSISNANEKTVFNLSGNFYTQQGIYIKDDYSKGIVNLNIKHRLQDNLAISAMVNVANDTRNDNTGLAYTRNPLYPVYNDDGTYFTGGTTDYNNPMALTDHRKVKSASFDLLSSLVLDWDIVKSLNFYSQVNYRNRNKEGNRYYPKKYTQQGETKGGAAFLELEKAQAVQIDALLTWKSKIGEKNDLSIMGGYSYEDNIGKTFDMESYGFVNETLQDERMNGGTSALNVHSNGFSETKLLSYMFRGNYTYDNKYLLTLTGRTDGSSKFGANNKYALFPSGALGWKLHNESFISKLGVFDEFKIRASYGVSGNQGISAYQTLSRFGLDYYYVYDGWQTAIGPGYIVSRTGADSRYTQWGGIPNKDLKWESTAQGDIGVDLAFFKRRLRLTADYYDKHTYDLLRESFLPLSSGFDKIWINDGEISNKGIELSVEGDMISTKDWTFSGTIIFSKNKNKVLSLGNAVSAGLLTDFFGMQYEYYGSTMDPFRQTSPNVLAIGHPVNAFYGYKVDGMVQSLQEGLEAGMTAFEAEPGEFKFVDLSGDGIFNEDDRTIIGDPNPDFMASLNLNLRYKNFELGVFFNGVFGNDVLENDLYNSPQFTPLRWTPDNPTNEYPRARDNRLYYVSDWFIRDGSFLRIQNVNLGYTFAVPKIINTARIYLNVDNLYTFTKFRGYDPEVATLSQGSLNGRYGGGYPRFTKYTLGIELTF
jgi:TonB-linked SusC/RagA family outer membrane protein